MTYKTLIAIPCLNEEDFIKNLVENLVEHTHDLDAHIVIVDGGSTDETPAIAKALEEKFQNVSYLENPKRIQSAAINLAVEKYAGDCIYLIRIDAHCGYADDYCTVLVEEADSKKADSVVVPMETVGKEGFQKAVAAAQNSKLGNGGSAHRNSASSGQWVDHGHHALMRIDAYKAVGGYDESFSHNEDAELDTRLLKQGYKIWLTGKLAPIYYPRSKPYPLFKQYYNYGKGRARTILKHKTRPKLRQLAPVAVAPAAVLFLLSPFLTIAALPLLAWAAICLAYGAKLGKKADDKTIMLYAGLAAMIMHLGWSMGFWRAMIDAGVKKYNDR